MTGRTARTTHRPPDVVIAGGGIAGLTLANVLRRSGGEPTVLERTTELRAAGAGLQLAPNATAALDRIGLLQPLLRDAVVLDAVELRSWTGRAIARTPLGKECVRRFGAPYLSVSRSDLQRLLRTSVDDVVQLDTTVAHYEQHETGVQVGTTTGRILPADALVGADGLHSVVRAALVSDAVFSTDMYAVRGILPAADLPRSALDPVVRTWLGAGAHLVCYPVCGGSTLSVTVVVHLSPGAGSVDLEANWRDHFTCWHRPVGRIVDALRNVSVQRLRHRAPATRCHDGRVVLIGDAAHPMLPFVAQGAAQSIEDAIDLGERLVTGDVSTALAGHERARRLPATHVQRLSREHGEHLHLTDGPGIERRDRALRLAAPLEQRDWLYGPPTTRGVA